ncbi:MAG: recombinase family protein [Muribaculaceae bacterium]
MKGAIYSRVSTIDQDYSKQTNELKDFAKRNNIEVVYVFEEKESGFNNDRPEFKKVQKLTKDDIDILLIWELSRLSRRSIYIQQQVRNFADKGVCIYTKKEGLYTLNEDGSDNKTSMLQIGFISIIAEQEVATFKERSVSSKRNKILKEGYSYTYNAPYGYDYDKETKKLSINSVEAEVIKRIFELSANGYSAYRIPVLLNADGIPTKKGNKWTLPTIASILTNPVYKGEAAYRLKGEKPKKGKRYSRTTEAAITKTPAIVTPDLFDLSRAKMKERLSRSKSTGVKYNPLLRGLIFCPYCKVKYVFNHRDQLYYCHDRYEKATNKEVECFSKSISIKKLDWLIWNLVKVLFSKELAAGKDREQLEPINREIEGYKIQIQNLKQEQNELTLKANVIANMAIDIRMKFPNLPDLYTSKLKEVETINKEAGKYLNEIQQLEKHIALCNNKIQAIHTLHDDSILVESIVDEMEKYELVHKVIDNIVLHGEGHYTLIVVTFQTGQVTYIGYYSLQRYRYYTVFYPSQDVWFDAELRKGYIRTLNNSNSLQFSLETSVMEYSIIDFINQFDAPENRFYYKS